ncbi:hypothetical protein SAMN05444158_3171 [Bradyrhizobium canariense]|uniref:Uncharacterized protein n=2 Tax=Bradyrhizobium canariense TaxID=255045 RepID=A0A1H1UZ59_9BRAD|nr:hypothetical protein SAMN05444158_3171 [Bradyrhizobium canariense]
MIVARVRDKMVCPADLQVSVMRVDGRWDAFPEFIDKEKHPDCLARIVFAATELRTLYDLAE